MMVAAGCEDALYRSHGNHHLESRPTESDFTIDRAGSYPSETRLRRISLVILNDYPP